MNIVVGYLPTPAGRAALRAGITEATLRSADLVVVQGHHAKRWGRHTGPEDTEAAMREDRAALDWFDAVGLAAYFVLSARTDGALPPLVSAWAGLVVGALVLVAVGNVGTVAHVWAVDARKGTVVADVVVVEPGPGELLRPVGAAVVAAALQRPQRARVGRVAFLPGGRPGRVDDHPVAEARGLEPLAEDELAHR